MKSISLIIIFFIGLILTNCSNKNKAQNLLKYKILNDEVYDVPIKTQVAIDVLITDSAITEQKVRQLLTYLYEKTIDRTGFKYHDNPTNIFIYAYTTIEKAESKSGQWVGMISKDPYQTKPEINISDIQMRSLTLKPVVKFGLSEKLRKEIWIKSFKLEDRAQNEADVKYPTDKPGTTLNDIKRNGAYGDKLIEKYRKELCREYGIKMAIIDSIDIEALTKGWALPKY